MNKLLDSLKGLKLFSKNIRTINPQDLLRNKRVAVVGPADSAYEKENADFINGFDYVIRINKALHSWNIEKAKYIGNKSNIWYHSFFENQESGGGALDVQLMRKMGVEFVVNPRTEFQAYRRTFNFFRKYKSNLPVYHLDRAFYAKVIKPFPKKLKPTIGYTALFSALNGECEELFITGFTFFKTPYAKGYRDHLLDPKENKKHFKTQGIHNADLEFELFQKELHSSNCQKIVLDEKLKAILKC